MTIITISRGAYSGIEGLAERLRDELGYRLFSREELLVNTAEEFGASASQLESALKHIRTWPHKAALHPLRAGSHRQGRPK